MEPMIDTSLSNPSSISITAPSPLSGSSTASTSRQQQRRSQSSARLKGQYLVLYNALSAMLWVVVLGRVLLLIPLVGFKHVYGGVGGFAKWTQTLAVAEVAHSVLGLVRSPLPTTALQIASRILLVWGIVDHFPYLAKSPVYSSMLLAWSVTEVVRYSYFVLYLRGNVPALWAWLRYNLFYVLYPVGIASETYLVYRALKPARKVRIEYEWALRAILLIYVPGAYIMYTHMMSQRRKAMKAKQRQLLLQTRKSE